MKKYRPVARFGKYFIELWEGYQKKESPLQNRIPPLDSGSTDYSLLISKWKNTYNRDYFHIFFASTICLFLYLVTKCMFWYIFAFVCLCSNIYPYTLPLVCIFWYINALFYLSLSHHLHVYSTFCLHDLIYQWFCLSLPHHLHVASTSFS